MNTEIVPGCLCLVIGPSMDNIEVTAIRKVSPYESFTTNLGPMQLVDMGWEVRPDVTYYDEEGRGASVQMPCVQENRLMRIDGHKETEKNKTAEVVV